MIRASLSRRGCRCKGGPSCGEKGQSVFRPLRSVAGVALAITYLRRAPSAARLTSHASPQICKYSDSFAHVRQTDAAPDRSVPYKKRNEEMTIQICDRLTELQATPFSNRMKYRRNLSRLHTAPAARSLALRLLIHRRLFCADDLTINPGVRLCARSCPSD